MALAFQAFRKVSRESLRSDELLHLQRNCVNYRYTDKGSRLIRDLIPSLIECTLCLGMWRLGGEFTFHLLSSLIYLVCLATLFSWVLIRSCKRGFRRRRHVYTENIVEKASDRRLSITRKGERPDLVRYRLRKAVVQSLFHGPTSSSFAEKSILLSGYLPEGGGDIVGLGMLTLKGHLVVSMKTDGGSLQRPTLGFYAPTDCIQPLIASVKATTGIISGLRSRIKAVSPLGFEIVHWMPVSSTKPLNMNNYENVLVAVGWPDTSGGNVLDRPDTPSVEILKLFQRNLVLSLSDVIILVLSRVNRSHLNSIHQIITQAHTMSKKILALHVNISEEEFQVSEMLGYLKVVKSM